MTLQITIDEEIGWELPVFLRSEEVGRRGRTAECLVA
jgi:hypothetical protein